MGIFCFMTAEGVRHLPFGCEKNHKFCYNHYGKLIGFITNPMGIPPSTYPCVLTNANPQNAPRNIIHRAGSGVQNSSLNISQSVAIC